MKRFLVIIIGLLLLVGIAYADSVTDTYTDETKIASKENVYVDTSAGQVRLAEDCSIYDCGESDGQGGCQPKTAGEQGLPACQRCNGSSLTHVNITNNTHDTEGLNTCTGFCQACQSGSCGYANAGTDPGNDCSQGVSIDDGCRSDNCNGSGACAVLTSGDGGCPAACYKCSDSDIACEAYGVYVKDTTGPYTCSGSHECCKEGSCSVYTGNEWPETANLGCDESCSFSSICNQSYHTGNTDINCRCDPIPGWAQCDAGSSGWPCSHICSDTCAGRSCAEGCIEKEIECEVYCCDVPSKCRY